METGKSSWTHPLTKNAVPQLRASEIAEMTPEDQFFYLLRKSGITSDCTWESTLRVIINDPLYSTSLKSVSEKKEAFAKYLLLQKEREKTLSEKAEQEKRNAFKVFLARTPQIHLASRWRSVIPLICKESSYLAISSDREREILFEETLDKLREEKRMSDLELQKQVKEKLLCLLEKEKDLNWTFHLSTWDRILPLLEEKKEWCKEHPDFSTVSHLDLLLAYESIVLEKEAFTYQEAKKKHSQERSEACRRRIVFSLHLETLVHKGLITSSTQWIENLYPLVKDSPVFVELLYKNSTGSCPLDLFYDVIDRLEGESSVFDSSVMRYLQEYPHGVLSDPSALADVYHEAEIICQKSEVLSGLSPISPRNRSIKGFVQSLFHHLENLFYSCREFKDLPELNGFSLIPFPHRFRSSTFGAIHEKNYRTGLRRLVYVFCADALYRIKKEERKRTHAAKRVLYDEFKTYLKSNRSFVLAHDSWSSFKDKVWNTLEPEFSILGEHLACRAFERFKEKALASTSVTNKIPKLQSDEELEQSKSTIETQTIRPRTFKTFSRATSEQEIEPSILSNRAPQGPIPSGRGRTISSYSDIF